MPLPPDDIMFHIGAEDAAGFVAIGEEFFGYFVDLAGLRADHDVLEIGCGAGRMARPLTTYLRRTARYEGFDIYRDAVEWCRREITPRHPNFRFVWANLHSVRYNPASSEPAAAFRFPYDDDSFDFAFATSVFTHLVRTDLEQYLAELARVLRAGAPALLTYFLLTEESKELLRTLPQAVPLHPYDDVCWLHSTEVPEFAVAYEEAFARAAHDGAGLPLDGRVYYGAWCGRTSQLSAQDIVIARRAG